MQQTDKYQLNLIETSDTFSPAPLNENTQKLEAAIAAGDAAEAQTRAEADAALDARLQVFEARHFVIDTYEVVSSTGYAKVQLGFTPKLVMVMQADVNVSDGHSVTLAGTKVSNSSVYLEIINGGFQAGGMLNYYGNRYSYLAIG